MGLLDGKVGVVLGASSGIGWRIAERYAAEGAELIVAARRMENLEKLASLTGAVARRCDATEDNELKALADFAIERYGRMDFAVNSSGVHRSATIRDLTPEILTEVAATQFFGAHYFIRHFANAMADHGGGSLIPVTSATAVMPGEGLGAYSSCKAGINFLIQIAAVEYGAQNVRVNGLAPGFVPTAMNGYGGGKPLNEADVDLPDDAPSARAFLEETPLKRIITVDDCADVALWLASDLSRSMTGQLMLVDGGNNLLRLPSRKQFAAAVGARV